MKKPVKPTKRFVRFRGARIRLADLEAKAPVNKRGVKVSYQNLYQRIVLQGWTPERAATTPLRRR